MGGARIYPALCAKDTRSFRHTGYPGQDANTVIRTDDGPEKDLPHFYGSLDEIIERFSDDEIERVCHTDDCCLST